MARTVVWLTAALLLLIPMTGVADASTQYVRCHLKNDWPPYKTGDDQTFTLPALTRPVYEDYRAHCDFDFDIEIHGEIDHPLEKMMNDLKIILNDNADFRKALEAPSNGITVHIETSGGGDVNTALRIGRILRDLQAHIIIGGVGPRNAAGMYPTTGECVSSCVFLLAGGVSRLVIGRVGVHRPYFTALSTKRAPDEVARDYGQQRTIITKYLNDMNVPASLLDFMDETPPESVHYLTELELTKYHLNADDPIFNERQIARGADIRGLTSAQYRQRIVEEDTICGPISKCSFGPLEQHDQCLTEQLTCIEAVSWGLSIPEYLKRGKEAQRCGSLGESASVDALRACVKAAMLGK
jgi:hypothetical protein